VVCGKKPEVNQYCKYDSDCEDGFCCDWYYPNVGECKPCEGDKKGQDEVANQEKPANSESTSPKCQYDADCPGGYCCYQEIPGLDGECVVCGKKPEVNQYCKYDSDCEVGFCCDWYYPNVGECKPCEKDKKQPAEVPRSSVLNDGCFSHFECPGVECCFQENLVSVI
jgi:hypothetical protein